MYVSSADDSGLASPVKTQSFHMFEMRFILEQNHDFE